MYSICYLLILFINLVAKSEQHGAMIEPPSRNAAWTVDEDFKDCCTNYDYNQLYCGGTHIQWLQNGGKCGVCGDQWDGPRDYEKDGAKYLGKIVRTYTKESIIPIKIRMTANHKGYFEFRICKIDGWTTDVTQDCLNKTMVKFVNTDNELKYVLDSKMEQNFDIQLPKDLVCQHCVLQWKWVAAKDWGVDEQTGKSCMGCGLVQENSYNCADITIKDDKKSLISEVSKTKVSKKLTPKTTTASTTVATRPSTRTQTDTINKKLANDNSKCEVKLKFGNTLNISKIMGIFCEQVCNQKCKVLLKEVNKNLMQNKDTEPSSDLLACIDTCPVVCDCK